MSTSQAEVVQFANEFTDQNPAAHAVIVRVPDICFLTQLWKKKMHTNAVLESKHDKVTLFWTESTYNRNTSGYTCALDFCQSC